MNKQEAKQKLHNIAFAKMNTRPDDLKLADVMQVIDQIDEPQTVVVPKFVAEWYERNKDNLNTAIYSTITETYRKVNGENDNLLDTFEEWLVYEDNSILILIQMQFFGFEIEQEKLYTVEIPNPNSIGTEVHILMMNGFKQVVIKKELGNDWKKKKAFQLTEEEIKQDFEWAWQFREEVD
ncbi:TPA: DUF1642 domain-containing protein [Streptococcus suis]|nr:DUF1642 domain-containing protein [Streptococcus suis]HEM4823944.1 DUF1642 domain-containing protein [Streptococcus suis]